MLGGTYFFGWVYINAFQNVEHFVNGWFGKTGRGAQAPLLPPDLPINVDLNLTCLHLWRFYIRGCRRTLPIGKSTWRMEGSQFLFRATWFHFMRLLLLTEWKMISLVSSSSGIEFPNSDRLDNNLFSGGVHAMHDCDRLLEPTEWIPAELHGQPDPQYADVPAC